MTSTRAHGERKEAHTHTHTHTQTSSVRPPVTSVALYLPLLSSYSCKYSTWSPSPRQLPSLITEAWQKTSSPPP